MGVDGYQLLEEIVFGVLQKSPFSERELGDFRVAEQTRPYPEANPAPMSPRAKRGVSLLSASVG